METGKVYTNLFTHAGVEYTTLITPFTDADSQKFHVLIQPGQSDLTFGYDFDEGRIVAKPSNVIPSGLESGIAYWIEDSEFREFGFVPQEKLKDIDFTLAPDPQRTTDALKRGLREPKE